MKLLPIVNLVILSLFSVSSSKGEEALDRRLEVLIHEAQFRAQREVIQFAARPMFNHVNDWQRWVNQVNAMPANQINGLMNLLNPHQRQFLLQRQRLISQNVRDIVCLVFTKERFRYCNKISEMGSVESLIKIEGQGCWKFVEP